MTKKNDYNKADLNKEAVELFVEVKKDIDETEKRIKQKREKFNEEYRNGAMLSNRRFIL